MQGVKDVSAVDLEDDDAVDLDASNEVQFVRSKSKSLTGTGSTFDFL